MLKTKPNPFNIIALTIAGIVNAFGVAFFLAPVDLYDSGISGTSMLLAQITRYLYQYFFCSLIFRCSYTALNDKVNCLRYIQSIL